MQWLGKSKRTGILIFGFLALLCLSLSASAASKVRVVTSFLPVYCFTANVAGNLANVENLLPQGSGPHDYQFSRSDAQKLSTADLFIVNGLGAEDWLERAVKDLGGRGKPLVVHLSAGLIGELIHAEAEGKGGHRHHDENPHIWLDPQLVAHGVTNILDALKKADPANAAGYTTNAASYLARLKKLDEELQATLSPLKSQPVLTFHNAFPYFTKRYGLNLVGVVEEVPDVEPSPRALGKLLETIRSKHVKTIFTEPQFSSKLARQIAADTGVAIAELDTLEIGPLTSSAYEDGMRRNADTLKRNLK
jgi:zinc transport system substrate-binding protein